MNAQYLYDFREKWEFCSGTDLHEFFRRELNGFPSPPGQTSIDKVSAMNFVLSCLKSMEHNNPTEAMKTHCTMASLALYNSAD